MARESPRRMRAIAARTLGVPAGAQREVSADARWGGMRSWAKVPHYLGRLGRVPEKASAAPKCKKYKPSKIRGSSYRGKVLGPSSPSSFPEQSPAPPNCPWGPPPSDLAVTNFHDNGEFFMGDDPEGAGRGCCGAGGGEEVLNPSGPMPPNQVQASELYLEGHLRGGRRCMDTRAR